jgi:hypothetical protein
MLASLEGTLSKDLAYLFCRGKKSRSREVRQTEEEPGLNLIFEKDVSGVLKIQEHGASICLALMRAFWLNHNTVDGIMTGVLYVHKDHMVRQESRKTRKGPDLAFMTTHSCRK